MNRLTAGLDRAAQAAREVGTTLSVNPKRAMLWALNWQNRDMRSFKCLARSGKNLVPVDVKRPRAKSAKLGRQYGDPSALGAC